MKNFLPAVTSFAFAVSSSAAIMAQVQGQWTGTGAMQSPREFNAQVPLPGGKVLSVGGVDNNGNVLATAEIYSPVPGTWSLTGGMKAARDRFPAVVLKTGKVLVSGGLGAGGVVLKGAEIYDPTTATWSPAGNLSVARLGHTATLLTNGKVLVAGGCTTSTCSGDTAASELYDPMSNSWSPTGKLSTARYNHGAVLLNNDKVLAVGGYAGGATSSAELYDAPTGKWMAAASTHTARNLSGVTRLADGEVLVTGGAITRFPLNSAEIYNPTTNLWTLTGTMTTGRYAHTSTLLADGTVLVAGGEGQSISCGKDCTGFIPTAKAEIYSQATGAFTATTSLERALAYHSTTPTTTGQALTSGGEGYGATCCTVVSDAEYYTPLTLSLSASSLDFGVLKIGLTSAPQTVTVTNLSRHASTFSSIASNGDYAQTNNCPTSLAAHQHCAITVTFKPTAAGPRAGAVRIRDNDPGSPRQTIALTGTGETLALALTPSSLDLGSVAVGSSTTKNATLTNAGAAPVGITGFAVSPADGTFTQTNDCPKTLGVQKTCTIKVVFTPPDVFTYGATLSITNGAGAPAKLPVSGTGLDGG